MIRKLLQKVLKEGAAFKPQHGSLGRAGHLSTCLGTANCRDFSRIGEYTAVTRPLGLFGSVDAPEDPHVGCKRTTGNDTGAAILGDSGQYRQVVGTWRNRYAHASISVLYQQQRRSFARQARQRVKPSSPQPSLSRVEEPQSRNDALRPSTAGQEGLAEQNSSAETAVQPRTGQASSSEVRTTLHTIH